MVIKLIGAILLAIGVVFIYDARKIVRKIFKGLGSENEGTLGLKILGTVFVMAGGVMFYLG